MMTGRKGVTAGEIQRFRSTVPNVADSIFNPLYDYQLYPTAGSLNFTFFTTPQGQGTTSAPGATGAKTLADTNLDTGGMLPRGNRFLCKGVEVEFWPGSTPGLQVPAALPSAAQTGRNWNDVYNVLKGGVLTLVVQNRNYVQDSPLMKFPTSTRLDGVASINATANAAASAQQIEYAASCGALYNIVPVYLESTQNFKVTIQFPAVIATPSGVDGRLGVRLVGNLVRDAQ